ncbi:MAG: CBS domain-containing protein, partial [Flavobacteriales bacterium]|nr:CBS domain-containing protein [Flavobacteriales bacterium]
MVFKDYLVNSTSTLSETLKKLESLSFDILLLFVIDDTGKLVGAVTDGDIRRGLITGVDVNDSVHQVMNKKVVYT